MKIKFAICLALISAVMGASTVSAFAVADVTLQTTETVLGKGKLFASHHSKPVQGELVHAGLNVQNNYSADASDPANEAAKPLSSEQSLAYTSTTKNLYGLRAKQETSRNILQHRPVTKVRVKEPVIYAKRRSSSYRQGAGNRQSTGGRPYDDVIRELARKHNVPVGLAHAVIRTESNYNVVARGAAGEIGLMQIKLSTARGLGYSGSAKALYNPRTNLEYGMKYLGRAYQLSAGNTCQTILKYNAGHGAKRMNPISARYCSKVKAYLASFN